MIGVLVIGKDRSFFASQLNTLQTRTVAAGLAGLLLFGLALWLIGRNITKPLHTASTMMNEISTGDGNLDVALD